MNLQRKLTLMVATGAVALGAGHMVQKQAADRMAAEAPPVVVSSVMPVAAGPEAVVVPKADYSVPALVVDTTPAPAPVPVTPLQTVSKEKDIVPTPVPEAVAPEVATTAPDAASGLAGQEAAPDCARQLDLIAQPGVMIGITLLAPCNPDERVVLRHAGLAVTGRTTAGGALFATLPALTAISDVEIGFANGDVTSASIDMPDATKTRRFAVQWQAADAFQLHAFENGADYNQPGHISSIQPGTPGTGGFLTILGDSGTDLPLLAEVYTFGSDDKAEVVLEAAVTPATCGREILGETVMAEAGSVEITDLTLAMPECDGLGDILVLKNLLQTMKLAAAN